MICRLFCRKERIDLVDQFVCVRAVYIAGFLNGFSAGMRSSESVHADLHKELCRINIVIENIADQTALCNFHNHTDLSVYTSLL